MHRPYPFSFGQSHSTFTFSEEEISKYREREILCQVASLNQAEGEGANPYPSRIECGIEQEWGLVEEVAVEQ